MKIGYFIDFKWMPVRTGASIHASQMASRLIAKGHTLSKIFYDYDIPILTQYRRNQIFKFLNEVDLIYIRVHEGLRTDRYSLLKACKFFRLPVVWEINAPLEENISLGQTSTEIKRLVRWRNFYARFVDAAITTCDELSDYARQKLKIREAYTIPLGSDPEIFSPQKRNDELFKEYDDCFKIVWAGSAQYSWQALDVVHSIAKELYKQDKKIMFFIIGRKENCDLSHLAYDNIRIIDRVTYDEVVPYIASGDMGLCLYNQQPGTTFYRSPLKLFDYMACGLPVISNSVGQINSIVRHMENGILVNENNVETIVRHILMLKNNPETARRMGEAARADIERHYNWQRVADETEVILSRLVNKTHKRKHDHELAPAA